MIAETLYRNLDLVGWLFKVADRGLWRLVDAAARRWIDPYIEQEET